MQLQEFKVKNNDPRTILTYFANFEQIQNFIAFMVDFAISYLSKNWIFIPCQLLYR